MIQRRFHSVCSPQSAVLMVATLLMLLGGQSAAPPLAADKPAGELRIALAFLGAQRLLP